jgi:hypothetical protein
MQDYTDPKWRYKERVNNLVNKGLSKKEAEEIVSTVIETKESHADSNSGERN